MEDQEKSPVINQNPMWKSTMKYLNLVCCIVRKKEDMGIIPLGIVGGIWAVALKEVMLFPLMCMTVLGWNRVWIYKEQIILWIGCLFV